MSFRSHPSRRSRRHPVRPSASAQAAADRHVRVVWAAAETIAASREAAIGKVALFGDAPTGGRVRDVVFELETGAIMAYEIEPGDGPACFVPADRLDRETPCTLHFAPGADPEAADEHEFVTMERFPPALD